MLKLFQLLLDHRLLALVLEVMHVVGQMERGKLAFADGVREIVVALAAYFGVPVPSGFGAGGA